MERRNDQLKGDTRRNLTDLKRDWFHEDKLKTTRTERDTYEKGASLPVYHGEEVLCGSGPVRSRGHHGLLGLPVGRWDRRRFGRAGFKNFA